MKRWRAPKAKPGELKACWGKLPHDNPDMVFCWGQGTSRADSALLYCVFGTKRARPAFTEEELRQGRVVFDDSFLEELEKRGYGITTLKFSIQKKPQEVNNG